MSWLECEEALCPVREDTSALPYLGAALRRLLAELPDVTTGLSRTERLILDALPVARRFLRDAEEFNA